VLLFLSACQTNSGSVDENQPIDEFQIQEGVDYILVDENGDEVKQFETAYYLLDMMNSYSAYSVLEYSFVLNVSNVYDGMTISVLFDNKNYVIQYLEDKAYEGGEGYSFIYFKTLPLDGWEDRVHDFELYRPSEHTSNQVGYMRFTLDNEAHYYEVILQNEHYLLRLSEEETYREFETSFFDFRADIQSHIQLFTKEGDHYVYCSEKEMVNSEYGEVQVSRCYKVSEVYYKKLKQ
jgi:hypothetical protein